MSPISSISPIAQDDFDQVLERVESVVTVAFEGGVFEPLTAAMVEAISSAKTADDLWRLFSIEQIDQGTFIEDEHSPAEAHALLAKAEGWDDPEQAAQTIGLAVRCGAMNPAPFLRRNIDDCVKEAFTAALEIHIDFFRKGLSFTSASMRSACAHAIAHCRVVTEEDGAILLKQAEDEPDEEALAACALALGAIARRGKITHHIADVLALFEERCRHSSALVRTCAAAGKALAGARLDERTTAILIESIESPVSVPSHWGWRWISPPQPTTVEIGVWIFGWADVSTPTPAIRALLQAKHLEWFMAQGLIHLGFHDTPPRLGVALEELDDNQRAVIAALASLRGNAHKLKRFGLWTGKVALEFLQADGPHWRPLDVETPAGHRRWHLARIWRGYVWDEISRDAAVDAVTKGIAPAELLEAICISWHGVLVSIHGLTEEPVQLERDKRLAMAAVEWVMDQNFDATSVLDRMANEPDGFDSAMLTICLLACYGRQKKQPPAELDALFARGITKVFSPLSEVVSPEPLISLMDALEPERRAALLANVNWKPTRAQ